MVDCRISAIVTTPVLFFFIAAVIILQSINGLTIDPSFVYQNWRRRSRLRRCNNGVHYFHRELANTPIDFRLQIRREDASLHNSLVKLIESDNSPSICDIESSVDRDSKNESSSSRDDKENSEYFVTEALFVQRLKTSLSLESTFPDRDSKNESSSSRDDKENSEYFVTEALFVLSRCADLGPAARILTEEFYSHRTNFITFQIERLKTSLSLESTFPKRDSTSRCDMFNQPLKQMFVACNNKDGTVLGFAEVDASPLMTINYAEERNKNSENSTNNIKRPYMYNLAVDKRWKRKGIARALIRECENFVRDRHKRRAEMVDFSSLNRKEESSCSNSIPQLFLKVWNNNTAAISLYKTMEYREIDPKTLSLSQEEVNIGSAELGELVIFAKDLIAEK
eukprot:CAMPEP_0171353960 /NCGR_PEP_ID=MMETSP0878-20121228/44459_1 /TAXON_ID=67004 /ORGANISM="Thalassiosira weissflogii, Strain CCMP1336" /LENGTH=395 /DNA_ID=CAMNT_0011859917 /DNA_START=20 /DNA_END=1208 /DNA_ORIENTATION=-